MIHNIKKNAFQVECHCLLAYLNNKLFSVQKAGHLCFKEIASRLACMGIVLYSLIKVQIPEIRLVTCGSIKSTPKIYLV